MKDALREISNGEYRNILVIDLGNRLEEWKDLVTRIDQGQQTEVVFDKWSLKDILAHFSHWAISRLIH